MQSSLQALIANLEKVLVGKRAAIELVVAAMLAKGHVLIDDVPGVGKTMLVKSLAKSTGLEFRRIQFTPDLLPADITGVSIYNPQSQAFEYRPGPLVANLVLADEVNRTSPRTQSSLLEAMEEQQITVDGQTHHLPQPFMILATQNPIEYEGTYPLPESQLDRFMLKVSLGYPSLDEELTVLTRLRGEHPVHDLGKVITGSDISALQLAVCSIHVAPSIDRYLVQMAQSLRQHPDLFLGVSPRGTLALARLCQAWALLKGRDYVLPDDAKYLLPFAWAHRLILKSEARLRGRQTAAILMELLGQTVVPA
ncbi:MAG: AAA family ATPase [Bacillota bacterium]